MTTVWFCFSNGPAFDEALKDMHLSLIRRLSTRASITIRAFVALIHCDILPI